MCCCIGWRNLLRTPRHRSRSASRVSDWEKYRKPTTLLEPAPPCRYARAPGRWTRPAPRLRPGACLVAQATTLQNPNLTNPPFAPPRRSLGGAGAQALGGPTRTDHLAYPHPHEPSTAHLRGAIELQTRQ